jgi:nitrogen-specific signal transduction histidine kinase/CheY-like chemotaxis protein
MPAPKSPLDKPSSSHSRRQNSSRRSSNEKSSTQSSTTASKHGVKSSHSSLGRMKDLMSDLPSGAKAPSIPGERDEEAEQALSMPISRNSILQPGPRPDQQANTDASAGHTSPENRERLFHGGYSKGDLPKNVSPEEVERLRAAMNAQLQLNQHREKLAKQLGEREVRASVPLTAGGKVRVSPIHEETMSPTLDAAFASPLSSALDTTSTESAKTVRGGMTPVAMTARTPSYPFPPMRTPSQMSYNGHRPFTALSPTVNPLNYAGGMFDGAAHDRVLSGSVTPASTLNFQPRGSQEQGGDPNFATPNLYDMSLMLAAEPGLDPWWTTVVQLMRDAYKAERVTLSVPADSTDVENVPWGQKATFNAVEEDELSLTYLPRGSSMVPSSIDTNETSNSEDANADDSPPLSVPAMETIRPGLLSRHSFTAYEDTKREPLLFTSEHNRAALPRPTPLVRAKSYLSARPDVPPRTGTLQNAQLNLQSLQDHMDFEDAKSSGIWETTQATAREVRGRIFSVLQALDYEADPLIDSSGVLRVLERGKVIALTRDYPYLDDPTDEKSGGSKSSQLTTKSKESPIDKTKKGKSPDLGSRISSFLGSKSSRRSTRSIRSHTSDKGKSMPAPSRGLDDPLPLQAPKYEEYEQSPPSPWAQSPAPSPAVRAETGENPFFANTSFDEETFNPNTTPQDYTKMQPLEAIGVDRSWTVLHIPLSHPLLSKPVQSFRLDAAAIESRSAGRGKGVDKLPKYTDLGKSSPGPETAREKGTPIAILSILSPVIPYPSNLRHSLEHLAPHLATSFSLCRHYSNLENEVAGLSRKRPQTAGFGAVGPGSRSTGDHMNLGHMSYSPVDEHAPQQSLGGSITSPSDYSGFSRSTAGSPGGTPGWPPPGSVGLSMDRRSTGESPLHNSGEGYFSSRSRPGIGRVDTGSASSVTGARRSSKASSPAEVKTQQASRATEERSWDPEPPSAEHREDLPKGRPEHEESHSSTTTPKQETRARPEHVSNLETSENRDLSPSRQQLESLSPRRQAMRTALSQVSSKTERVHTQLHSYGADFGATFQSLPITTSPSTRNPTIVKSHSRTGSLSVPNDMPPPSDRLKGLMLDSLPAHVFVALPQTGEIVWVNNRYLTYRGQTVAELYENPWGSIHPDERDDYLKAWGHAVRTGEQFSMQVRIKRFDGTYRWFYTRAVGSRDIRGVIVQWYGSHMDIHDQHIAEVKAARQEEIEASEAKHRQLANLIPQIIFAATEDEGVTFANEQWLSYTGQDFNDALGLGFMDYVHPEDLAKCHIPIDRPPTPSQPRPKKPPEPSRNPSQTSSGGKVSVRSSTVSETPTETTVKGIHQSLSRNNSSSSSSVYEVPTADLSELARTGVIKVTTDSNGRLSYTTEVRLKSKKGEYRWHLVRCVEVDNINLGSGDGSWFGACTDINDHKLLETKLKEAMESKGKFLSNMSHEIRTPLIGISGMVNFLQDTVLNDEQMDYTNTIQSSASSLLNIINDILDLSKVDAGMMKLSYEWFHTRSLVEEVNEMVSTMAITKRLELNYMVAIDVPEMVKGDKFRIRQVLLNVIGNAIKFTTVGEVFCRCRVVKDNPESLSENETMLEYSIIDTGRGFSQEEADLIFKPFSQIDGSSTRQHGGSGLGLVISRQLVELHGGKMEGSAVPGKGSTFTFTARFGLPTAEDHPEPPLTPALSQVPSARSSVSNEVSARAMKQAGGNPILANKLIQSPATISPRTESSIESPTVVSSGSSEPSLHSTFSHTRSSSSSVAQSLAHFGEAARVSGPDLSQMKLALPERNSALLDPTSPKGEVSVVESGQARVKPIVPASTSAALSVQENSLSRQSSGSSSDLKHFRPPMYSILLICPQAHSREATTQHIEITLPKDIPHQITPLSSITEAQKLIGGDDPVIFTHIVLNLGSAEEIVTLVEQIITSISLPQTSIVVLSDPVQRQEVIKMAAAYDYEQLAKDNRVTFIYKPVKPSRFAVIFDPDKERDLSTDRNRSSAQQQVANQKQNYVDVGKRLGNKGLKVLLVEDNLVNQKVLLKFLSKVGIAVELALDGVECTDKVFSRPHSFYSLILVSCSIFPLSSLLTQPTVRSSHAP